MVCFQIFTKLREGEYDEKVVSSSFSRFVRSCFLHFNGFCRNRPSTYGASERIRQEIWDNVIDLKTLPPTNGLYDRNFFRFKTSLWGSADFNKDVSAYLKLTSEVYYNLGPYKYPSDKKGHFTQTG